MDHWIGLGPDFSAEWLTGTRRWQMYALRSVYVLFLLLGIAGVALSELPAGRNLSIREQARVGQALFTVPSILLLGLMGLAAPSAIDGVICQETPSGNLP